MGARCLYLHGLASGPGSAKGVAFAEAFAKRGVEVERLNLRRPSLERLRLSAGIAHVIEAIGDSERVVLIGSSLGGLTAARVAEQVPAVQALVLLAPAFKMAERWNARHGDDNAAWRRDGWLELYDHAEKRPTRLDIGFLDDALATDVGWPTVTVPTWIAHGTRDDVVDVGASRQWIARTPSATLTELDDGHELIASLPLILERGWQHLAPWLASA